MTRVRFAPSPTGSLHVGNALSAVANRRFGDWLLLRIDGTDPARYPAEAVRAYLEELDLPRHDVHLDLTRIRSLSVDVLARMSDEELAARLGAPVEAAALGRGAHDLVEARALVQAVLDPPSANLAQSPETLERFV